MSTHAVLSPSAASRWTICTKSARLEQQHPDTSGEAAREGTLAHKLSELIIKYKLKRVPENLYMAELQLIMLNKLYSHSMFDYCDEFSAYVLERYSAAQVHTKDALIFLEQKLNLTDYIPEGFGTGDVIIIADTYSEIIDLKYGKGVSVSAENNKQIMLYALGLLREYDYVYAFDRVFMTIYQPRLDNISTFEMEVSNLRAWATDELIPKAKLAFAGAGEFVAGTHCQFCKVRATCRANKEFQMDLARYEFAEPVLLTDEEVAEIIGKAKPFETWLNSVTDHALSEALKGKKWPGYKLVSGRSIRRYSNEDKVAEVLVKHGVRDDIIYTKKLIGITALEKEITKPVFNTLLDGLIIKPPGAPTLVIESDKRDELGSVASAIKDFANE